MILELHERGGVHVLAGETRPLLQGARLTVWELARAGVGHELVVDGAMAGLIRRGEVDAVDRGRRPRGGQRRHRQQGRHLSAGPGRRARPASRSSSPRPTSTIDADLPDGDGIEIEERDGDEVRASRGVEATLPGTAVRNPAFDVTPAALVTALVTERGVARPPDAASVAALLA